jgi:signal transduction histidine kinase
MSNNTEINNRDQDINALKSAINNLRQENKQLLESNEQLKKVDSKLRDFINIAAHELRTPIMPILGVLEIAEYDLEDEEEGQLEDKNEVVLTKQQFQYLKYNANRLEKLASNILDLAKIENNILSLNKEQFSLVDVIAYLTHEFQREIKRTNKKLEVVFHIHIREQDQQQKQQQKFVVKADKNRIIQVIYNLLNNSLKFAESKVYVTIEKDCNDAIVIVKDDGSGIDDKIMPRLFTRFATTTSSQGTGLGLFISKVIIETHHGRIWAENNSNSSNNIKEAKGATFGFSLPLHVS